MWQRYAYIALVAFATTTALTYVRYRTTDGDVLSYSDVAVAIATPVTTSTPVPTPTSTPTPTPTAIPTPTPTAIPSPTATPTPTPLPMPEYTPEQIHGYVEQYSGSYALDPNMMRKIVQCESGFNEKATNGPYAGLFQFSTSTWISTRNAMGMDPDPNLRYHAEEAVKTGAFKISRDGYGAWPACSI